MIEPPGETRLAALRLQIEGSWSVEEFQSLLLALNDVYQRVAAVMTLGDLLRQEEQRNEALLKRERLDQMDWSWSTLYWGTDSPYGRGEFFLQREPLSRVIAGVQPLVLPLGIDAVRLESPGWVQIIGNLNPLKVMADFVSKWRAENTKRLQISTMAQTERERTQTEGALERERMLRGFALEVLRQLPEGPRGQHGNRLAEIAEYAITPGTNALQRVANDVRVIDAGVVNAGASLPQTPPPSQSARRGREVA